MVAIISELRSLRFRLVLTIGLIVALLTFASIFLVSTEDLKDEIQDQGKVYSEKDTRIFSDLEQLEILLDTLEREQISSFLGDIYFKRSLDEITGDDTVRDIKGTAEFLGVNLNKREQAGYSIEAELNNQFANLMNFQVPKFGGYDGEDDPIVDRFEDGANMRYQAFLDESAYTNQSSGNIFITDDLNSKSNDIRATHNSFIKSLQLKNETIEENEGAFAKLEFLFDEARNDLQAESNQTLFDEILDLIEFGEHHIQEYVFAIVEFENTILRNKAMIQADKIIQINNFTVNLLHHRNEVSNNYQSALTLTTIPDLIETLNQTVNLFENTHDSELQILNNNAIQMGIFIADTKQIVFQVDKVLVDEQKVFDEEFEKFLNDLQNDLQRQTQLIFVFIILSTVMIIGSVSFTLIRYFSGIENNYKKIEGGNLKIRLKTRFPENEMGRVNKGFANMVEELIRILSALQRSSERMAGIAEELAAGSEEASASVQEVANTVREFSAGAAEQNILLSRVDNKLSDHLKTIEEATNQINETSHFVLKVAKRTNILGLNASIEAAKAGKFGKGFNVVAREVRKLSDETKKSATEIAGLVDDIETRIQTTVRDILREVDVTKGVAENTAAGSEEANAATSEQVVMLNEISSTSNELSLLANELQEILGQFDI